MPCFKTFREIHPRSLPTLMTSEQPDKYMYCKIENKQIAMFLKKSDFFRIRFELRLDIMFYASLN